MNIFATSECPRQAARDLDDRRVVNQVRETAQLLSTATRRLLGPSLTVGLDAQLYKSAHERHPVTEWVSSSWEAFCYTLEHGLALHAEYCERYPDRRAVHASSLPIHTVLGVSRSLVQPTLFRANSGPPATLRNCAANLSLGLDFRSYPKVVDAYRMYLATRWQMALGTPAIPTWSGGSRRPDWFRSSLELARAYGDALGTPRDAR